MPSRPTLAAALGDDPERPPGRDRRGLALEQLLAGRLEDDRAATRRAWCVSPTSTVPGGATDWRRDAVLTRSPATIPWPTAPIVTAASPVRTPARSSRASSPDLPPEVADGVDEVEGRPHRPLGVVLVGDRRAPDGHHGVADELLDRAAVALDDLAAQVEVARQELADLLRVGAPRSGP